MLFRSELLHLVDTVVLDKTGTITMGKPKVTNVITSQTLVGNTDNLSNSRVKIIGNTTYNLKVENELLKIAGSLEKNSEHPLAEAVLERAQKNNVKLTDVTDFSVVPGRGLKGKIDGIEYFGGNLSFMNENNIDTEVLKVKSENLSKEGKSLIYFARENNLIGLIAIADTIKDTSEKAIEGLKNKKLEVVMLTGDNELAANAIGEALKIDKVIAEVLPQDKEKEVAKLQNEGKKVAFVGDGINDSPALVKADVGLAIGSGTDIAIESADIVLMKDSLLDVDTAIDLSKSVIRNIKMNLFWAFFYNIIGIPVAAGAFYLSLGLKLNPMIGAAAMSLSSVCVVTNALRLRNFKNKNLNKTKVSNNNNEINNQKERKVMKKTVLIDGMQCNHCKMSVEKALNSVDGIEKAEVILEDKKAVIECSKEIDEKEIKKVIDEAGFTFVNIIS